MSKRKKYAYSTKYYTRGVPYSGIIFAYNIKDAKKFARLRGLKEEIVRQNAIHRRLGTLPSQDILGLRRDKKGHPAVKEGDMFHTLCWFGNLALASKAATIEQLFADEGVIHQYAHRVSIGAVYARNRRKLSRQIKYIERRIPGFCP